MLDLHSLYRRIMSVTHHCRFTIKTQSPPLVEVDQNAAAFYVRFKKAKVHRTIPRMLSPMVVSIDLDEKEEVIGIEAVGVDGLSIAQILEIAKVEAPNIDFGRAVIGRSGMKIPQPA